jgi:arginase
VESKKKIGILGIPFSKGQPKKGTEMAPAALRSAKLHELVSKIGWAVHDHGDVDFSKVEAAESDNDGKLKNPRIVGAGNKLIHEAVEKMATTNDFALMLGGDHSIAIGYAIPVILNHFLLVIVIGLTRCTIDGDQNDFRNCEGAQQ